MYMEYRITSEQITAIADQANKIVANWNQKNEILRILWGVSDQPLPSGEADANQHLGRWG